MSVLSQYAPPKISDPCSLHAAETSRRRAQAEHDAQVVREIIAGCRRERKRHNRRIARDLLSWLFLPLQAIEQLFARP